MFKRIVMWFVRKTVNALRREGIDLRSMPTNRSMAYLGDHRVLTKTTYGYKMVLDSRDVSLTPHILLDGNWEPWIANFILPRIKEGFNIIEVGANIGYYTLLFAARAGEKGKVYAFEANPRLCDLVHQSLSINGLLDRVCLTNKAAYNKSGSISFSVFENYLGSSSVIDFSDSYAEYYKDSVKRIDVDAVAVDEFLRDKPGKIDFIKIDAEGSEPYIIEGMQRTISDNPDIFLVIEFTPCLITGAGNDPAAFLEKLRAQGFKFKYINTQSEPVEASIDELVKMVSCELYLSR